MTAVVELDVGALEVVVEVEEAVSASNVVRAVKLAPIEGINAKPDTVLRFGFGALVDTGRVVITVDALLLWTVTVVNLAEASVNDTVFCAKYDICVIEGNGVGEEAVPAAEIEGKTTDMDGGAIRNGVAARAPPTFMVP